jgi:transposase
MGKRGKQTIKIDPARVEELARTGKQVSEIAHRLDIGVSTYYQKVAENPDILEAYKKGRDHFLEYVKTSRSQAVLEAFDELIQQRNPAAVIFAMKAVVGLSEQMNISHSVNKEQADPERLKILEDKRRALQDSEIDAEFEKEHDTK